MRIISGIYRGRKINPPHHLPVRPTTDFAKEGIFSVLNHLIDFPETTVLDLFAGTGNMSFEFISRGCPKVTAVDIERRCVDFINHTAQQLQMAGLRAIRMNVLVFLKHPVGQFDLVFADPPFDMQEPDRLPRLILNAGVLKPNGLLIFEHSGKNRFRSHPCFLQFREYGKVRFSIFSATGDEQESQYSSS